MNLTYEQLSNPQFVSKDYIFQTHYNNKLQQQQEIAKAVKAIHGFCDASREIDPLHQQETAICLYQLFLRRWEERNMKEELSISLSNSLKSEVADEKLDEMWF